jgi:hypothetical protein
MWILIFEIRKCKFCLRHANKHVGAGLESLANFPVYRDSMHTAKIVVKNQQVSTYIDHMREPSFQSSYVGKIGKLKFLNFGFKGLGSIYFVRVLDGAGKEIYFEDFDNPEKPAKPHSTD